MVSRWSRVIDLVDGVGMVVTDLHGDWDAYRRYRDHFLTLNARGVADLLILTGDLVHYTGPEEQDASLRIVMDVLALGRAIGERLVVLLGNHELPHLYSYLLAKGDRLFTPRFQRSMGDNRSEIIALFEKLPFLICTRGGVTICHAGVSDALHRPGDLSQLLNLRHHEILASVGEAYPLELRPLLRQQLGEEHGGTYDQLARSWFAVSGPADQRYDDWLIGTIALRTIQPLQLLHDLVSTRNEERYGKQQYARYLRGMLEVLSSGVEEQRVLLSGHMDCDGGYTIVSRHHLRLASAKNAHPREAGHYLLLDLGKKVSTAADLLPGLGTVFGPLTGSLN